MDIHIFAFMLQALRHRLQKRKVTQALGSFDEQALFQAISQARMDWVKVLLASGISADSLDESGRSGLMIAAEKGHLDLLNLLLTDGAAVDTTEQEGLTALMKAAIHAHLDISRRLLAAGAEVDKRNETGHTALMLAIRAGNTSVARCLLEAQADPNASDHEGKTVLEYASFSPSLCKLLKAYGAVEKETAENHSAVEGDIPTARDELFRWLSEVGSHTSFKDQMKDLTAIWTNVSQLMGQKGSQLMDDPKIAQQVEHLQLILPILIELKEMGIHLLSILTTLYQESLAGDAHPQAFMTQCSEVLSSINTHIQKLNEQAEAGVEVEVCVPPEADGCEDIRLANWFVAEGGVIKRAETIGQIYADMRPIQIKALKSGVLSYQAGEGNKLKAGEVIGRILPKNTSL